MMSKHSLSGPLVGRGHHPIVAQDQSMVSRLELDQRLGRVVRMDEGSIRQDAWIRFTNSRSCLFVYFLLMLLNIFVLILEISGSINNVHSMVSVVCEGVINLFLVGEVVIGMVVYQWEYFKPWANRIDFVVTFLCLIFYAVFIEEETPGQGKVMGDDFEYADTVLLGFRYAFQVFRFMSILYRGRQKKAHVVADDIDFDNVGTYSEDSGTGVAMANYDNDNELVRIHRGARSDSFAEVDLTSAMVSPPSHNIDHVLVENGTSTTVKM